jgi:hypothetical protein
MTQAILDSRPDTESTLQNDSELDYRSMSRAAVLGLVFGLFGLMAWFSPMLIFLPVCGVIFSLLAFRTFRKYPNEVMGKVPATLGLGISVLMCLVAPVRHVYIYYTEVPEGYERIQFSWLTSPTGAPDVPTEQAIALSGKKVFLKGYIHPTSISSSSARTFVLVPDLGTCCFGGQPPLTHMIEVRLVADKFASKSFRQFSMAGVLDVTPYLKPIEGLKGVYYQLEAEHFQ